jgi:PAS domain S-box-containing protein
MRKTEQLFKLSRDLMCVASMEGYFREVNPAFSQLLGFTDKELTDVPFLDLVHPADKAATVAQLQNLRNGRDVLHFENRYRCKDGSYRWLAWVAVPESDENLIYAVARDVTDSKQSLGHLLADLPGMVYRCKNDADWTMTFVSAGCEKLTGYSVEEFVDRKSVTYNSIVHPEDRDRIHQEMASATSQRREFELEYRIISADGRQKSVWEKGRAIYNEQGALETLQGCIFDITERRKLESEFNQLHKMDSLGQLTGGVAHDFNNLLTVVAGNLELLEDRLTSDPGSLELVKDALGSAWRGAELCKRLLAFGRRQMLEPETTDINDLVQRVSKLARRTISQNIDIRLSPQSNLPQVLIDQGQLENAILNLAINARDAMPNGGAIHFRTELFHAGAAYAEAHPEVFPGDYVMIEVSDTGTGMPPEVRDRVFEPFYTTKDRGKGTGLGLSMVYGLLKQSGGHVRIYSEEGHGTSVKLFVPVTRSSDGGMRDTIKLVESDVMLGGTEQILVVEDDSGVRKMVATTLADLGYGVIEADSGTTALDWLNRSDCDIDLLFTDITMPGGVDGIALANAASRHLPGLKVLLTSGFSKNHVGDEIPFALLSKPYQKKQLASAVRQVLDS